MKPGRATTVAVMRSHSQSQLPMRRRISAPSPMIKGTARTPLTASGELAARGTAGCSRGRCRSTPEHGFAPYEAFVCSRLTLRCAIALSIPHSKSASTQQASKMTTRFIKTGPYPSLTTFTKG